MTEALPSDVPMNEVDDDNRVHRVGSDVPSSKTVLSSSDDTGSEDSSSESESKENMQVQKLEEELSNNPSNYNAHVEYIKCLRKQGHIDKLRKARDAMSQLFLLSPTMWQEWAKDEISLASSRLEAFNVIEGLYERGVFDYLSVSLWCDYLSFVQEYDPHVLELSPEGISKARRVFERAVTAAGSQMVEGSKIWNAYRKFELAVLDRHREDKTEGSEKYIQCIRSLFHRQLSVPLVDIQLTLRAYKVWEVEQGNDLYSNSSDLEGIDSHVSCAYTKALNMVESRALFEDKISEDFESDMKLQHFLAYLTYEETSGDPVRVQNLFERAVAEFPVSGVIWLKYIDFLDRTLKVGNVVLNVYSRATKSCPWIGDLWVRYLLSLERSHAPENEISAVFEKSLQCSFSSFEEYLDLFLTRVDGLRRRIQGDDEGNLQDLALIRSTFQNASDYLSLHLKNSDSLLKVHRYWAHLELNVAKDLNASRGVWESLLKISGSMVECWKSYIEMEVITGHIAEARSIFRRCYTKRFLGSGSEDICNSWLYFEREYGTLEDYDFALRKVRPRLEEVQLYKLQNDSVPNTVQTVQADNPSKKKPHEKRKASSHDKQPAQKKKKSTEVIKHAQGGGVGISNFENAEKVAESNTDKVLVGDSSDRGTKQYTDKCTAFISNLSLQATYEHLYNFFSDGGVLAIRILNDKFTGKSRGLAYVDFWDDDHLAAAVKKNKQILLGKKVSIARSDPSKRRSKGQVEHSVHDVKPGKKPGHGSKSTSDGTQSRPGASDEVPNAQQKGKESVNLKGKNTFAVPRTVVRPLGWTQEGTERGDEAGDLIPKSNEEFRKLLLKS